MALHLRSLKFKSTSLPYILSRCFATQVQSSCSGDKRPIADVDWEAFATEVTTICEEVKGRVSSVPQLSAASRLAVLVLESQRLVDAVNKHELANSSDLSANGSPGTCSQMSSSNKAVSWKKMRCRPSRIGQLLSAPRVRPSTGPIKTENVWADGFDSCAHLVQPYSYTTDDIIIRNPYIKENLGFFGGFLLENSENKHLSPEYDQRSRSKLEDNDLLTFTNLPSEQFVHIFGEPIHYCAVPSTSVDLEPPEKPPLPPMKGGPDPDTLNRFREHIVKVLPKFFVAKHDYRAYHPDVVFENNYWGTNIVTNGLNAYAGQLIKYRCLALLKYAHIEVTVLKATVHPEDGTVRVRWRVKGLSQFKALMFWKFLPWTYKKSVKEESQWFDVYSVFTLNKDGYITKHRIDRVIPDEEVETTKTGNLALKLSLLLGLAPKPGLHDFASLFFRKSSGSAATSNT